MNRIPGLLLIFILLWTSSCNRKLNIFSGDRDLDKFTTNDFEFEYFQAKSKVKFQSPDQSISSSANLRIKKDSLIWISLAPALGIELARGIISRDTIIFIDRFNKDVYTYNFEQLSRQFNFPVNFDMVQAMLLGNLPLEREITDRVEFRNKAFYLNQQRAHIDFNSVVSQDTRKVESIRMLEMPSGNTMTVEYSEFKLVDEEVFPFLGIISILYKTNKGDEETKVQIEHSRAERLHGPISFPFSVPDKYGRP